MKLYLSNKSNLNANSNVDNLYKNKNYGRTQKRKKKKKGTNVEKKDTHVDNRGFGFWVEISTNYFCYCTWQIKHFYFF